MNHPRPNHVKRRPRRRLPSPVVPLYAPLSENNPPALVGYLNRRTGDLYTVHMNPSRPQVEGKNNKAHRTRVRAARAAGFTNIQEFTGRGNRKDRRAWVKAIQEAIRKGDLSSLGLHDEDVVGLTKD